MFKNDYLHAALIGVGATALSVLTATILGWIDPTELHLGELVATGLNFVCTWLFVKRRIGAYPVGIAATALWVWVFFDYGLLASSILNAWLSVTLIYGWYFWRKTAGENGVERPVYNLKWKQLPIFLAVSLGVYLVGFFITSSLGATLAPMDSVILAGTVLCQLMTDRRITQGWLFWAFFVNTIGTVTYAVGGLYLASIQQVLFGVLSLVTFFVWRKAGKQQNKPLLGVVHPKTAPVPTGQLHPTPWWSK